MAHVLEHVAAGVVPEEAPVAIAIGVEGQVARLTEEALPDDVLGRHVRVDGARPLRLAMRRIAVHVRMEHGDLAHVLLGVEGEGVGDRTGRGPLMADLHDVLAGVLLEGGAHTLGVVDGEGHRLFLVDMLARGQRVREVLAVEVLRGGDQDGVDVLILQESTMIQVRFGVGRDRFGSFEGFGIDIGDTDAFNIGSRDRLLENFTAAIARSDDADADAVVGSEDVGRGKRAGQTGSDVTDEITTRLHGDSTPSGAESHYSGAERTGDRRQKTEDRRQKKPRFREGVRSWAAIRGGVAQAWTTKRSQFGVKWRLFCRLAG